MDKSIQDKKAEDVLFEVLQESINSGDKPFADLDKAFTSLWLFFDPPVAMRIILKAMERYKGQNQNQGNLIAIC